MAIDKERRYTITASRRINKTPERTSMFGFRVTNLHSWARADTIERDSVRKEFTKHQQPRLSEVCVFMSKDMQGTNYHDTDKQFNNLGAKVS